MSENKDTPRSFDLILGGNNPPKQTSKNNIDIKNNFVKEEILISNQSAKSSYTNENLKKVSYLDSSLYNNAVSQSTTNNDNLNTFDANNNQPVKTIIKFILWSIIIFLFCFQINDPDLWGGELANIGFMIYFVLMLSWIVSLVKPDAAIRFGLPNNRASVSKLYTTLLALLFALCFCISNVLFYKESNFLDFILWFIYGFFILSGIFVLLYSKGTIFENFVKQECNENSFQAGCLLMLFPIILLIAWGLIVSFWHLVISSWNFVF